MNPSIYQYLCSLLAASISNTDCKLPPLTENDWIALYKIASRQGVLAIVYDAVKRLPVNALPSRSLRLQWALNVDKIERHYEMQFMRSKELAEIFARYNIKTVVLKGLGLGAYYPFPQHRECGDFDCYLCGEYNKGNKIAEQYCGAKVENCGYKHSHIEYKGLVVENHKFCIGIRGRKELSDMERYLENILSSTDNYKCIPNTALLLPPADFNAMFLSQHASYHFLIEGISLRHVCDWALFLKHEQNSVDWHLFYNLCEKYNLKRFVDVMTAISVEKLGVLIQNPLIHVYSPWVDKVFDNIMHGQPRVYSGVLGIWSSRWLILKNMIQYRWKYSKIYNKNFMCEILYSIYAFLFKNKFEL